MMNKNDIQPDKNSFTSKLSITARNLMKSQETFFTKAVLPLFSRD